MPAAVSSRQIFLQAMLFKQLATRDEAVQMLQDARAKASEDIDAPGLDDWITDLNNSHLLSLSLKLANLRCPKTGVPRYALVNIEADDPSKIASGLSQMQIDLFKHAMACIYSERSFYVSRSEILQFTTEKSMTKREGDQLIDRFIKEFWLQESASHKITFGVRTLMELAPYITQTYGPLPACEICKDVATVSSEWCQNPACRGNDAQEGVNDAQEGGNDDGQVDVCVLHIACRNLLNGSHCPVCRAAWVSGKSNQSQRRQVEMQSVVGGASQGSVGVEEQEDDKDDDVEEEEDDEDDEALEEEEDEMEQDSDNAPAVVARAQRKRKGKQRME
ncbi:MAG: hypothetical protein SGCHY_005218 [Lobulomycetales sp.]